MKELLPLNCELRRPLTVPGANRTPVNELRPTDDCDDLLAFWKYVSICHNLTQRRNRNLNIWMLTEFELVVDRLSANLVFFTWIIDKSDRLFSVRLSLTTGVTSLAVRLRLFAVTGSALFERCCCDNCINDDCLLACDFVDDTAVVAVLAAVCVLIGRIVVDAPTTLLFKSDVPVRDLAGIWTITLRDCALLLLYVGVKLADLDFCASGATVITLDILMVELPDGWISVDGRIDVDDGNCGTAFLFVVTVIWLAVDDRLDCCALLLFIGNLATVNDDDVAFDWALAFELAVVVVVVAVEPRPIALFGLFILLIVTLLLTIWFFWAVIWTGLAGVIVSAELCGKLAIPMGLLLVARRFASITFDNTDLVAGFGDGVDPGRLSE